MLRTGNTSFTRGMLILFAGFMLALPGAFCVPVPEDGDGGEALAVDLGDDRLVEAGIVVELTAVVTGGGSSPTFAWTQSGDVTVDATGTDTATVQFTAPTPEDGTLAITFEVIVTIDSETATDSVVVTVESDLPDEGKDWYLRAVAISLDDLTGSLVESLKGGLGPSLTTKAIASEGAQDALDGVLDAARDQEYDDSFLQIDVDAEALGTGLVFEQYDIDADYTLTGLGLPALELSTSGLLAEQLGIPIRVRRPGLIVAISQETMNELGGRAQGLIDNLRDTIPQSIADAKANASNSDPAVLDYWDDTETAYEDAVQQIESLIQEWPPVPQDGSVVSYATTVDVTFPYNAYSNYVWDPETGEASYTTTRYDFDLQIDLEFDMERNEQGDRWEGAVSADAAVSSDNAEQFEMQDLSVDVAVGLQRISAPDVIYLEPGVGTVEDGNRLQGEWLASFSGSRISDNMADATGFLKLQFDESGTWQDALVAGSYDGTVPADDEFNALSDLLTQLQDFWVQQYGTSPGDAELRVTLGTEGDIRLDLFLPPALLSQSGIIPVPPPAGYYPLGGIATKLINVTPPPLSDSFSRSAQMMVTDYPDFAVLSFVGQISGDEMEGNILFLTLVEPATFQR